MRTRSSKDNSFTKVLRINYQTHLLTLKRVTKSHIPAAADAPVKIDVPKEHSEIANESKARLKRGRPIGSKDKNPRKKKGACNQDGQVEKDMEPNEIDVDDAFANNVVLEVMEKDEDHEPKSVSECKNKNDWPKWKDATEAELKSFEKRKVFRPVVRTPKGVKPVGYKDMGLYYTIPSERNLVSFADAGYMSYPHTGRSQTGYVFTNSNTPISWRSVKQTMSATSSNHAKILAIHEASRKCVWLRNVIQHIRKSCGISSSQEAPTIVHKDNVACIAQLKDGYIKCDRTKHILPKFFFTHDLQKSGDIIVQQICSSDNLADLFTKALTTATFKKLKIGIFAKATVTYTVNNS
nr:retrovirus-related Pol polyprotein from transposon TNT 1-94 [Tanacetum cinerariifolium]